MCLAASNRDLQKPSVPRLVKKYSVFTANYCRIPNFQPLVDIPSNLDQVNVIYFRYALILSSLLTLGFPNDVSHSGSSLEARCGYLIALYYTPNRNHCPWIHYIINISED